MHVPLGVPEPEGRGVRHASTQPPGPSPEIQAGTERDLIEQALHRAQVHDGFPAPRRALAVALDCAGIRADDVDLLAASIRSSARRPGDSAPAILAALLGDSVATRARIQDLRRGHELRAAAGAKPYPGAAQWVRPGSLPVGSRPTASELAAWRIADLQRKARAIVLRDRKSPEEAAQALGVGVAEIVAWTRS